MCKQGTFKVTHSIWVNTSVRCSLTTSEALAELLEAELDFDFMQLTLVDR